MIHRSQSKTFKDILIVEHLIELGLCLEEERRVDGAPSVEKLVDILHKCPAISYYRADTQVVSKVDEENIQAIAKALEVWH